MREHQEDKLGIWISEEEEEFEEEWEDDFEEEEP